MAAASRIQERDTRTNQLIKVLVARDDHGLEVALGRAIGERRDDVIGLIAVDRDDGNMERIENLADAFQRAIEILLQLFAELFARRLVLWVLLLPE